MNSDLHAVFATDFEHKTYRVSDPLGFGQAHDEWTRLDDARRAGETPQFKFYEVRSVTLGPDRPLVGPEVRSHDRYDRAPLVPTVARVLPGRGYGKVEDAARAAWKLYAPTFRDRRHTARLVESSDQGRGGWFYWPNGRTAAQGLRDLARVCKQKQFVVRGGNGRWYVNANLVAKSA